MNHPLPLQSVLGDSNVRQLEIPIFQREYSWKAKESNQLFDDIIETIDSRRNSLLGLLVFISRRDNSSHFIDIQIVDGQQRTTTLSLLLAIVRSEIIDLANLVSASPSLYGTYETIGKCLFRDIGGKRKPLLQFHKASLMHAQLYAGLTATLNDTNTLDSLLTPEQLSSLKRNLDNSDSTHEGKLAWFADNNFNRTMARGKNVYKNYLALHENLEDFLKEFKSPDERLIALQKLTDVILSRLLVIKYETSDEEEAFFLFETLNDRGMAVAASDLIKNFCIQRDTNHIDEIGELWSQIFKQHLADSVQPMYFLRTYHNSRAKFVTKKDLFTAFKTEIKENAFLPSNWLRTEVLPDAMRFRLLVKDYGLIHDIDLKNVITALNATNSTQWQTVALSAYRLLDQNNMIPQIRRPLIGLLKEVLKAVITMEIKSLRGSLLEKELPEIARKVFNLGSNSSPAAIAQGIETLTSNFGSYRTSKDLSNKGVKHSILDTSWENNSVRPLISFLRLEDLGQGTILGSLTVEHVFPQIPDNENDWPEWYPDGTRLEGVKSIGNFIGLSRETNASVSNSRFEDKKEEYHKVNAPDLIPSDSPLHWSKVHNWKPSVVEMRSEVIALRLEDLLA